MISSKEPGLIFTVHCFTDEHCSCAIKNPTYRHFRLIMLFFIFNIVLPTFDVITDIVAAPPFFAVEENRCQFHQHEQLLHQCYYCHTVLSLQHKS